MGNPWKNWSKLKFSGKPFQEHKVPVNSKSIPANLGHSMKPDKMPPKR